MEQYRKSPRAMFLDYQYGDFFVTICTRHHRHYFGEIMNGNMELSGLGKFLDEQLASGNKFNDRAVVLQYVVMPNHLHAIIHVDSDGICPYAESEPFNRNPNPSLRTDHAAKRCNPALSRYINSLKGAVTKFAAKNGYEFEWQSRYHDHYIRGPHDGNRISEYIAANVERWEKDVFNI